MAGQRWHAGGLADGWQQRLVGQCRRLVNPGPTWQIKGTGDFNGDGKSDILWQDDNGTPAIWLMDGTNVVSIGAAGSFNPGPAWQIKGSGDFNGDGKSDILWQGHDGTPAIWLMDGTNVLSSQRRRLVQSGVGLARDHLVRWI